MPAHDLVIAAQWSVNNYTLTFIFDNGDADEVREVAFGDLVEYPEGVMKEEYIFDGWNETAETMPAHDLAIAAQWSEEFLFVEVIFGTTDLNEAEVIEALKKYTDGIFTIERFESDASSGSTQVIIKFTDPNKASTFVRRVEEDIKGGSAFVRDVTPLQRAPETYSYTHGLCPLFALFKCLLFL